MTLTATQPTKRYTVKNPSGERVGTAELRAIPVDALQVDAAYQRDKSSPWVEEHLPFNPQKCGAIIVSHRGGQLFIIDGQHRWELAKAGGVPVIAALVIEGMTKMQEAESFRNYQIDRRALTSWALWRADLVAELQEASSVQRAVLKAGFKVRRHREDDRTILTIDALRKTYRLGGGREEPAKGERLIEDTLGWIADMWLGEDLALSAQTIYGMALFLDSGRVRPEWNEKYLRGAMKVAPSKMARFAQGLAAKRHSVSMAPTDFALALVEQYDKVAPDGAKLQGLKSPKR